VVAVSPPTGQTEGVTAEQLELISTDPQVMHGHSVLTGTRVPVSVILDCLAARMTVEEIIAENPVVTAAGARAAVAYGAALARCGPRPVPAPCDRGLHA
jgi:uncharacterized protein (DUF433 family)